MAGSRGSRDTAAESGLVVFRRTGGPDDIDAIDQYSRHLVAALRAAGTEARYEPDGLRSVLTDYGNPPWVLLQYNPFRYGRAGFAPGLILAAWRLRRRGVPLAVMVHEAWIDMRGPKSTVIGLWQRLQLRFLLRLARRVMTSTEALASELGVGAIHVPVAANILPVSLSPAAVKGPLGLDNRLVLGLFGRNHPSRALEYAEEAISAVARSQSPRDVTVLNLGADPPALRVPPGVEVRTPDVLTPYELSRHLMAADLVMLPFADGVSTRRSTLMSALAHGRPVIGVRGRNTDGVFTTAEDALVLIDTGDRRGFARAAAELADDPPRRAALGAAGRRLYESQFAWTAMAERLKPLIEDLSRPAPVTDRVVFIAHDVGGQGGMEHHTEQLIGQLLTRGKTVTVIARTCRLDPHDRLRFVRIPTPPRPFPVAYPAFFALASLTLMRHGDGIRHTTGAIVANRVDVTTVHYCHAAVAQRTGDRRSAKARLIHRVNARMAHRLSVAGERWCYRSARTTVLCPVSFGVAEELRSAFPSIADSVQPIPNGVDTDLFRPDPELRAAGREELEIAEDAPVVAFVGGDWSRKGVAHAVDAIALAPEWHLVVAGPGDAQPFLDRARASGIQSRVHFLGAVAKPAGVYATADAFVLPTSYEAFPLAVLEAAASGLPLLVTRVNGVDELLEDGESGWFIEPSGADIARRLRSLSARPELAASMSARARQAVAKYSWPVMAERYMALYGELDSAA